MFTEQTRSSIPKQVYMQWPFMVFTSLCNHQINSLLSGEWLGRLSIHFSLFSIHRPLHLLFINRLLRCYFHLQSISSRFVAYLYIIVEIGRDWCFATYLLPFWCLLINLLPSVKQSFDSCEIIFRQLAKDRLTFVERLRSAEGNGKGLGVNF